MLTGLDVEIITESGAPQSGPAFFVPQSARRCRRPPRPEIFSQAIRKGLNTICFTQARKLTELIHVWAQRLAPEMQALYQLRTGPGFCPEERREIERALASGKMRGVISTSALEMGIDIGGLDVCILVGYPGTMVTTWQRAGRVGRQDRDTLIVMVAQADALDQYFIKYPAEFFGRPMEAAVVDPDNRFVVKAHLPCAAQELPLKTGRERLFSTWRRMSRDGGTGPGAPPAPFRRGQRLVRPGPLSPEGREHPGDWGESFAIFQVGKKKPLGSRGRPPGPAGVPSRRGLSPQGQHLGGGNAWTWTAQHPGEPRGPQVFHPHPDGKGDGDPGDPGHPPGGHLYGPHRPPQGHRAFLGLRKTPAPRAGAPGAGAAGTAAADLRNRGHVAGDPGRR